MKKNKFIAAFLNLLVPGLGTAYAGKVRKGIIIYFVFIALVLAVRFVTYNYSLFLISIAAFIAFCIYAFVSGYRDIPGDREPSPTPFSKGYYWMAILAHSLLLVFLSVYIYSRVAPVNFAKIPTPSMDPGLKEGDRLAYQRTSAIERNDIVLFRVPYDSKTLYAQRCIGMPGDSLRIENGVVFANNRALTDFPVKYKHYVQTNGADISPRILEQYHLTENNYMRVDQSGYFVFLTAQEAQEFRKIKAFQSVEQSNAVKGQREEMIFPKDLLSHDWNTDFYGPLYIPKQGDEIELTADNVAVYLDVIKSENQSVDVSNTGLIINSEATTRYKFKDNYYFIMGDNRHNALDSRYWGLLPQSLVEGTALYIYWSAIPERIGMSLDQ